MPEMVKSPKSVKSSPIKVKKTTPKSATSAKSDSSKKISSVDKSVKKSSSGMKKAMKSVAMKIAKAAGGEGEKAKKVKKPKFPNALYRDYAEPRTAIPWPSVKRVSLTESDSAKSQSFCAISWNVGGLNGFLNRPERVAQMKKMIKDERNPNLIALMETKLQEDREEEFRKKLEEDVCPGYKVVFNSCINPEKKGYSGVAMLYLKESDKSTSSSDFVISKIHKESLREGFYKSNQVEDEGRILLAEYPKFMVLAVYTPNSGDGLKRIDHRLKVWDPCFRALINSQSQSTGKPIIAIGDFNAAHLDADIWNLNISKEVEKQAGTTPMERESFGKLLSECKLIDSLRKTLGKETAENSIKGSYEKLGHFSYWSQRVKNKPLNRGLRLDYCLIPEKMSNQLVEGFCLKDFTAQWGDHCPVGLRMKF